MNFNPGIIDFKDGEDVNKTLLEIGSLNIVLRFWIEVRGKEKINIRCLISKKDEKEKSLKKSQSEPCSNFLISNLRSQMSNPNFHLNRMIEKDEPVNQRDEKIQEMKQKMIDSSHMYTENFYIEKSSPISIKLQIWTKHTQ